MFTKDEFDMLSLRSSSIYCRYAPIRYVINPSFAKQTYRVRQHISSLYISPLARYANHIENPVRDLSRCVFSVKDNTHNSLQTKRARIRGENPSVLALVFSSVDIFTFVKYVHERWIRYVLALLELDILSLRANSIWDKSLVCVANISSRRHIELRQQHIENPARDLSRCVFSVKDNTQNPRMVFDAVW